MPLAGRQGVVASTEDLERVFGTADLQAICVQARSRRAPRLLAAPFIHAGNSISPLAVPSVSEAALRLRGQPAATPALRLTTPNVRCC